MVIWFASGNVHKKRELATILASDILSNAILSNDILVKTPSDAGLEFAPEETGNSFVENALIKAVALYKLLEESRPDAYTGGDPIIADDSGLCVDALDGRPGIHSAYYGGIELSSKERNTLVLSELGNNPMRNARFVCAMVLYYGPERFYIAQEKLEGELARNMQLARGLGGFGYDPILYLPEFGRTVAELSDEEKNRISHRGKAAMAIGRFL